MTYEKIVIPMDHGNRNMKTKEDVFTSGLEESDMKPILGDYLMYDGKYYSLTGKRIPFMKDKTQDERFFILTLFGIGKELEKRHGQQKDIIYQVELPVGDQRILQSELETIINEPKRSDRYSTMMLW